MTQFFSNSAPFDPEDIKRANARADRKGQTTSARLTPIQVLVNPPGWFKAGIKFKSKWIKEGRNICTLLSFDKEKNTAEVRIKALDCQPFDEPDWNLQHTIWGFENSDYTLIEEQ